MGHTGRCNDRPLATVSGRRSINDDSLRPIEHATPLRYGSRLGPWFADS